MTLAVYERKLEKVLAELPEQLRAELEDFFLDRHTKLRSVRSKLLYAYVALSLARHAGIRSIYEIDRTKWREWRRALVRQGVSDFTLRSYIVRAKALVRWAWGLKDQDIPRWLKEEKGTIWDLYARGEHLLEKLIRPEELERLMSVVKHPRDKAIIAILAETGVRIGELLSLRFRDVEELPDGTYRLRVHGKTGTRPVIIVRSAPALRAYLAVRRGPHHPGAPVFTTIRGPVRALRPESWARWLRKLALEHAHLDRPITPHQFRHTRMTQLAAKVPEMVLKKWAGWSLSSKMPAVYVHLSGRDVETVMREVLEGEKT